MTARSRPMYVAAALAVAILFAGPQAKANDLPAAPVPDSELAEMRGGFLLADGVQFNFGALMQTLVNGQLAMRTQVTYTPNGPQVAQTVAPNAVQGATMSSGKINGLKQAGFDPATVTVLPGGATALIQKITGGVVQNIVINTASKQNIQQSTQLQLQLPGFAQTAQLFQQNLAMSHLLQNSQTALVR